MSLDFGEDSTCFSVTRISLLKATTSASWTPKCRLQTNQFWPLQELLKSLGDYLL